MRHNVLKKNSTKAERIVYEVLKSIHIPFKHRWKIDSREVDFIVGNLAIDIDGHEQDSEKNMLLVDYGYIPIHFSNKEITKEFIKSFLENNYDN